MAASRQAWCWRSWEFYIFIWKLLVEDWLPGSYHEGLNAHVHRNTLILTRPHLQIVPLLWPSIYKPSQQPHTLYLVALEERISNVSSWVIYDLLGVWYNLNVIHVCICSRITQKNFIAVCNLLLCQETISKWFQECVINPVHIVAKDIINCPQTAYMWTSTRYVHNHRQLSKIL